MRQADRRSNDAYRGPTGAMLEAGSGVKAWANGPKAETAGSPAILGDRPEDRRFCVPAFRRVCPCQQLGFRPRADVHCSLGAASRGAERSTDGKIGAALTARSEL